MSSPPRGHTANVHLQLKDIRQREQERDEARRALVGCEERVRLLTGEVQNDQSEMVRAQKAYDEACSRGGMIEAAKHAESSRVWEKTKCDHTADLDIANAAATAARERLAAAEAAL
jgi:hypothetical protein